MAPVLVCPECQTKHPLDTVGARSAFPCAGCGRTLKVPGAAVGGSSDAPPPARPAPEADPNATQVFSPPVPPIATATAPPSARVPLAGPPPGMDGSGSRADRLRSPIPPAWARFVLWIVAVPLAFLVVFGLARAFGVLSTNDITDVALAEGWHRFVPIVRLLPFVAVVTALFVHGGVFGIARLRQSRRAKPPAGDDPSRPNKPGKPRSRPRPRIRQSSDTGA